MINNGQQWSIMIHMVLKILYTYINGDYDNKPVSFKFVNVACTNIIKPNEEIILNYKEVRTITYMVLVYVLMNLS